MQLVRLRVLNVIGAFLSFCCAFRANSRSSQYANNWSNASPNSGVDARLSTCRTLQSSCRQLMMSTPTYHHGLGPVRKNKTSKHCTSVAFLGAAQTHISSHIYLWKRTELQDHMQSGAAGSMRMRMHAYARQTLIGCLLYMVFYRVNKRLL